MPKKDEKHLALTTGQVACSNRLTASFDIEMVTQDWQEVGCRRCKRTEFYKERKRDGEEAERQSRNSAPD